VKAWCIVWHVWQVYFPKPIFLKKLMLRLFKLNNRCFVGLIGVVEYNDFLSSWTVRIEVLLSTTSTFAQNHNKSPFLLKVFPTCIHFYFCVLVNPTLTIGRVLFCWKYFQLAFIFLSFCVLANPTLSKGQTFLNVKGLYCLLACEGVAQSLIYLLFSISY